MSRRLSTVLAPLIVASFALAACGGDDGDLSSKIFNSPPWDRAETLTYNLDQRSDDDPAACVLTTEPGVGETTLTRSCEDDRGFKDDGRVVVVSGTLEPKSSERILFDVEDNETTTHRVVYEGDEARFETSSRGKTRDTTRDLPEPTEESPDPGWYDDESLLWLIRGIELREGYEAHYTHVINAGAPRVVSVDVSVRELETVDVPAGQFRAWRVRVSRDSVYTFWVDEASPHRVVKAQIEDSTYELTKAE